MANIPSYKLISFVLAESHDIKGATSTEFSSAKSAPHYFKTTVPHQWVIGKEESIVAGREVTFTMKAYQPDVLIIEAVVDVADPFSQETFDLREHLINGCHEIVKKRGGDFEMSEAYSIVVVSGYTGSPEQFLGKSQEIVGFLKSERLVLDEAEVEHALTKRLKYGQNDLVIVGWDGAVLFEQSHQYGDTIELFQLANFQLLRYRMLDKKLNSRFQKILAIVQQTPTKRKFIWSSRDLAKAFREVIAIRTQSVSQFEDIDREIRLIGDWYSARLYEILIKTFRVHEWRESIKEKLDSLEDVYDIASENFSITRHQALELAQILFFFVLQVGWFILIILEWQALTRH